MTAIHYSVEAADLHAHLFRVTLTITQPASQQTVSLPVWIPGSYLVREFAKNLQNLTAKQGRRTLALAQRDKCTWDIACKPGQPLVLSYEVCAFDNSVRTAWLDSQRGFFNGTSLCLRVHGQEAQPHQLQLKPVKGQADWQAATGLNPIKTDKKGFGLYQAADYDELVDHPVELGAFWRGRFEAGGVPHEFVVAGRPSHPLVGRAGLRLAEVLAFPVASTLIVNEAVTAAVASGGASDLLDADHGELIPAIHVNSYALARQIETLEDVASASEPVEPDLQAIGNQHPFRAGHVGGEGGVAGGDGHVAGGGELVYVQTTKDIAI